VPSLPRVLASTQGVLLVFVLLTASAAGAEKETAKSLYEKATGAYALGNYKKAAELYERAFELKPDPALLFNGAQAHRLAGNKERAYELYRSYLRVFPNGPGNVEAARHADNLKRDLDAKTATATSPPPSTTVLPPPATVASATEPPPTFVAPSPNSDVGVSAAPEGEVHERSLFKRPLFWVVTGAVVLAAAAGIAFAATRGKEKDPVPTFGGIE
jgi:hypothetical protein